MAMNVFVMGEKVSEEELAEAPATELEDHFAPVTLSPAAIDRASQVVPEEYWKPVGLHTWLSGRANQAFRKLGVREREVALGRLKYAFEFDAHGPVLRTVILL